MAGGQGWGRPVVFGPMSRGRRLRVLHLTTSFPRREGDPSGQFIFDLTTHLAGAGVENAVVAPHDAGAARREHLGGAHVRRFRYAPPSLEVLAHRGGIAANMRRPAGAALVPPFLAAFLRAAWLEARRFRPDVIHAHWWVPAGVAGALVGRRLDIPLVVTLHGTDLVLARGRALRRLARWVVGEAAVVGAVSEALRADSAAQLGVAAGDLAVLRMPLRIPRQEVAPPPPPPPLRILAVGRLVPEKGFDVLVDAVERLLADGVDVQLDIIGDGPDLERLAARVVGVEGRVRLLRARPHHEVIERLGDAHALVVPSLREGLGLVALEALAVGRPVVASAVGGLPEAVRHEADGILVPPADPGALAEALRRLPLPPPVAEALARHDPATVVDAHLAAYRRAASWSG